MGNNDTGGSGAPNPSLPPTAAGSGGTGLRRPGYEDPMGMSTPDEEMLVKVRIELSAAENISGERFWAKPLGDGLYELRNTPFFANDLNWGDIVRCDEPPDEVPVIVEVVQPSGHQTVWVLFAKRLSVPKRSRLLKQLKTYGASYEHAQGPFYAI